MRRWLFTALLAVCTCAAALAAPVDPQATLQDLTELRTQRFNELRNSGKPLTIADVRAMEEGIKSEAQKRLKDVEVAAIAPAQGMAFAQLYTMAGDHRTAVTLLDRYLTTSPDAAGKWGAQTLLLSSLGNLGDGARLAKLLREAQPPTPRDAATFATLTGARYADLVAKSEGSDAALAILDMVAGRLKDPDDPKQRPVVDSARAAVAGTQAELYATAGKKEQALQALDAGLKALTPGSPYGRQLESQRNQLASLGSDAPALKVTKTLNGEFKDLSAYKGKVVVLDFFAHWCPPCIASIPDMRKLYDDLRPQGLEMLGVTRYFGYFGQERGIAPDAEYAKMQGWVPEKNINWPVLFSDPETFTAYGVSGIPQVTVIDRQGKIHKVKVGYSAETFKPFRAEIERMLRE